MNRKVGTGGGGCVHGAAVVQPHSQASSLPWDGMEVVTILRILLCG